MCPELTESEETALHKEAWELFDLYLKSSSIHKVNVSDELVKDIFQSEYFGSLPSVYSAICNVLFAVLCGPASNVSKLRTTTPLFKAFEEIFNSLERFCPAFYKSEQVGIR